jgi:hypothetical protein
VRGQSRSQLPRALQRKTPRPGQPSKEHRGHPCPSLWHVGPIAQPRLCPPRRARPNRGIAGSRGTSRPEPRRVSRRNPVRAPAVTAELLRGSPLGSMRGIVPKRANTSRRRQRFLWVFGSHALFRTALAWVRSLRRGQRRVAAISSRQGPRREIGWPAGQRLCDNRSIRCRGDGRNAERRRDDQVGGCNNILRQRADHDRTGILAGGVRKARRRRALTISDR